MKRSKILKVFAVALALPLLYLADVAPDAPRGLTLVRDAHAIVSALPAGCKSETKGGVENQDCGGF